MIIIDYESTDIDIEAVLSKSSLRQFTVVRIPREEGFKRAMALQQGAEAVKDPHSVLFLCDLHLKIPSNLISTIRKVRRLTLETICKSFTYFKVVLSQSQCAPQLNEEVMVIGKSREFPASSTGIPRLSGEHARAGDKRERGRWERA